MDSLMLSDDTTPIVAIDGRNTLYYGKYRYRARLKLYGLNRTYNAKSILDVVERITRYGNAKDKKEIDIDCIERFIEWKNKYANPDNKSEKQATIRVEYSTAGVFSNDLQLLQTLELIAGSSAVDYTEIDTTTPTGTKYFTKQPKHNYRLYLKSKRVTDKFVTDLSRFIDRYKDTDTVIVPSDALKKWLNGNVKHWLYRFCSSHYYIEYDDESSYSLMGLMFGDMIKARFKLEKRPD
jgi:hypothetical protein